jgi:hypothetical protein
MLPAFLLVDETGETFDRTFKTIAKRKPSK